MTTAKHTPGPWAVNPFNALVDATRNGSPLPICKMLWPTDERSEEETEANASLIASAPDLLDALKAAVEIIGHPDDAMTKHFNSVIAKAESRS